MRHALLALLLLFCTAFAQAGEPTIGDLAPAALGNGRNGKPVTLEQYRGKVVVVTFWASWCTYCLRELPVLNTLQEQAGGLLQVIAVNVEDSNADYRVMLRQMKEYTILQARDAHGDIAGTYGVTAYPNLWIIDREGRIAAHHRGYGENTLGQIVDEINDVLRKAAARAAQAPAATPPPVASAIAE